MITCSIEIALFSNQTMIPPLWRPPSTSSAHLRHSSLFPLRLPYHLMCWSPPSPPSIHLLPSPLPSPPPFTLSSPSLLTPVNYSSRHIFWLSPHCKSLHSPDTTLSWAEPRPLVSFSQVVHLDTANTEQTGPSTSSSKSLRFSPPAFFPGTPSPASKIMYYTVAAPGPRTYFLTTVWSMRDMVTAGNSDSLNPSFWRT